MSVKKRIIAAIFAIQSFFVLTGCTEETTPAQAQADTRNPIESIESASAAAQFEKEPDTGDTTDTINTGDTINEEFAPRMIWPGEVLVPLEGVEQTIFSGHKWPWLRFKEIIPPALPVEAKLIKSIISMDSFAENYPENYEKIKDLVYVHGSYRMEGTDDYCVLMPEGLGGIGVGYRLIIEFDNGAQIDAVNVGTKPSDDEAQTYEISYAPDGTMIVSQMTVLIDPNYIPEEIKESGDASHVLWLGGFGAISKVIIGVPAKIVSIEEIEETEIPQFTSS